VNVWVTTNSNGEKRIDVEVGTDTSSTRQNRRVIEDHIPTSINGVAGRGTEVEKVVHNIPVSIEQIEVDSNNDESDKNSIEQQVTNSNCPGFSGDVYYWHDWDNQSIPGGTAVPTGGQNTLGFPANGGRRAIKDGHSVENPNGSDIDEISVMPRGGECDWSELKVNDYKHDGPYDQPGWRFDGASLGTFGGIEMDNKIADEDGKKYPAPIDGGIEQDALEDVEHGTDWNETLVFQGSKSGRVSGFGIKAVNDDQFRTDLDSSKLQYGDSGGPLRLEIYDPESYYEAYMLAAGINSWREPGFNTNHTGIPAIKDEFDKIDYIP